MKHEKIFSGAGGGGGPSRPDVAPISFRSEDIVELTLAVSEGPIAGLLFGPRGFYLDNTPLASPSGEPNFDPFELNIYHGDDDASPIVNSLGGRTSNQNVAVSLREKTPVVRVTPTISAGQVDTIELRFLVNQLMKRETDGDVKRNTLRLQVHIRPEGSSSWEPFSEQNVILIYGRVEGAVKEYRRQVPRIEGNWEIRVEKLNPDGDDENIAEVAWESTQVSTNEPIQHDNLAIVRALSGANEQLNGNPTLSGIYAGMIIKIPSNYDPVTRYCRGTWDGSFKWGHTNNPAWILYDLLTNTRYGAKAHYPQLQVDRFSFYQAAQWCDGLVPRPGGGYQPRYTFNDLMSQSRGGLQALRYIAGTFGGVLTKDAGGVVGLKVDRPGPVEQIFGPESVAEDEGFSYQYTDVESRPNVSHVTFINPDLDWKEDHRRVEIPVFKARNGLNQDDFRAIGCIDVFEAQRRALLRLLTANTEKGTVSFRTSRQGALLEPYSIIGISDPKQRWGLPGRVKSVDGDTIHLRDALYLPTSETLTMSVQTTTGPVDLEVSTKTPNTRTLQIESGSWPSNAPNRAQFSISSRSVGLVKPFRVLSIEEDNKSSDTVSVTAIEINPTKHSDVDNGEDLTDTVHPYGGPIQPGIRDVRVSSGSAELVRHGDGRIESRIRVSFVPFGVARVELRHKQLGADGLEVVQGTSGVAYVANAVDGQKYELHLVAFDENGKIVSRHPPIVHLCQGKSLPPSVPQGWSALPSSYDTISVSGNPHPDVDFAFHSVYARSSETGGAGSFIASDPGTSIDLLLGRDTVLDEFQITATDTSGNESKPTDWFRGTLGRIQERDLAKEINDRIAKANEEAAEAIRTANEAKELHQGLTEEFEGTLRDRFLSVDAELDELLELAQGNIDEIDNLDGRVTRTETSIGSVQANLVEYYLTSVETNAAITLAKETLGAEVADVRTELDEERVSRAEEDAALSRSISSAQASIGAVTADLEQNYMVSGRVNEAIAAAEERITATISVRNSGFEEGTAGKTGAPAGWKLSGGSTRREYLGYVDQPRPGSDGSLSFGAIAEAPSYWILSKTFEVKPGQLIDLTFSGLVGGQVRGGENSNYVGEDDAYPIFLFRNAEGNVVETSVGWSLAYIYIRNNNPSSNFSGVWKTQTYSTRTVPEDAVSVEIQIVAADANGHSVDKIKMNEFSGWASVLLDDIQITSDDALIEISDAVLAETQFLRGAQASTEQALATFESNTHAALNGLSSDTQILQNSVSDLEGNASSVVGFRARSGNQLSFFDLMSGDGRRSYSIARVRADEFLVNASVTMRQLAITSNVFNVIPVSTPVDEKLAHDMWDDSDDVHIQNQDKNSGSAALRSAPTRKVWASTSGNTSNHRTSFDLDVTPGEVIKVQFDISTGGSNSNRNFQGRLFFADENGEYLTSVQKSRNWTSSSWGKFSGEFVVPNGAATCYSLNILTSGTAVAYWTKVKVLRMNAGELTVDGSIFARHLAVDRLDAISANLGSIKVGRGNITDTLESDNYRQGSDGYATRGTKIDFRNGIMRLAQGVLQRPVLLDSGSKTPRDGGAYRNEDHIFIRTRVPMNAWGVVQRGLIVKAAFRGRMRSGSANPNEIWWWTEAIEIPATAWYPGNNGPSGQWLFIKATFRVAELENNGRPSYHNTPYMENPVVDYWVYEVS